MPIKKIIALLISTAMLFGLCACADSSQTDGDDGQNGGNTAVSSDKEYIEETLNLANNENQEWTYSKNADAWVLSVVSAVAYPELPNQQGVSVCVPGAYIKGIDTNGDGEADVTASSVTEAAKGSLVIDYEATVTSTNGQVYTATTAPIILNTGAAGYGSQNNSAASTTYAADGYINVSCGNRGKQDTATDENGNTYYTGDAPSCLVDQKAAARYVKYNILLGNLPGNVDYLVSTGGSGGGAHAVMFAATSNNPDFYEYQIEAGAVGVYKNEDGSYSTTVTIDGVDYELSDGAWGCIAYSAITSLYEADMALAFEYYLDAGYSFKTSFQKQLAEYLSESYMEYINAQNLSVKESDVGFDLDGDGALNSTIALTIEHDLEAHPETNGYYGTYLDLYLAEFTENLQWYVDSLDYAEGWTWFDEDGKALSDAEVATMTSADKALAFVEGRYAKGSTGGRGNLGDLPSGMGGAADFGGFGGGMPDGDFGGDREIRDGFGGLGGDLPDGEMPGDIPDGGMPGGFGGDFPDGMGGGMIVGTPDGGTTQSATGSGDSANYASYAEMVEAYRADIEEIYAGDKYGNNIVSLYNPLNYIGADDTDDPTWTRILMGASEGDMSMFSSLNLQIAWLNADVDAVIEWQWNGGHVPSEILGDSFSLYVDEMYGDHVEGALTVTKPEAVKQTANGNAENVNGNDLTAWVRDVENISLTLDYVASYRTSGASKAMPGFDVIDYGQEDYVFGSTEKDARHWDKYLLEIFEEHADVLEPLFNLIGSAEQTTPDGFDNMGTPPDMPTDAQGFGGGNSNPPDMPSDGQDFGGGDGVPMGQPGGFGGFGGSQEVMQGDAANTIETDGTYAGETYTSNSDDENALRVVGANATLDGITVNKESGATSNTENGDFYGMNAALLATDGANVTITNATVKSSAQNGNGVFSYGSGTVVNISDSTITTTADNSGGIQTTGGGTTNAKNLQVTTNGSSSAAIRSDRGGGTVNVDGGSYTSNGYNSPAVYSTADITVKNAALTATNSEALVIEGKNSIILENCTVSGNMSDTKGTSSDINVHNVMIYQSMSGDADVGTSVFSMRGGSLISNNGDMFYVTNTHCVMTLSGVEIANKETNGYFLLASGNSAKYGWGNAGSNGAQVEFTADGQTFEGDIAVDSISSLTMTLKNGSVYTGAVNIIANEQNGSAVDNSIVITIDSGSVWNLTGDCTVTSLTNNGTINFNGHTIKLADGTVLSK